jgi:two-component system phosphate regulon sensor histidine kinase PhoR
MSFDRRHSVRSASETFGVAIAGRVVNDVSTIRPTMLGAMDHRADDLARLGDQAGFALLHVGPDLLITLANDVAHQLLSKRTGTLLGRSVMEAFVDHRVEEAIVQGAAPGTGAIEVDGPAGRRLLIRVRPDRTRIGARWVLVEDVTELRRLQRIRSEFIDNLSHELRTPLTSVRLLTERLADEMEGLDVPDRVRDRVTSIDVETGHLVQMVNELLDLSRIEQGTTLHLDDVPPLELLEATVERVRMFADRAEVSLAVPEPAVPVPPIRGDRERLGQLLLNLLHNAVKFSFRGGTVTAAAEATGDEVVLSIQDEGIGIARADQGRIFERFYKADRSRERSQGGTGLGLAIARHIAEAHGGSIRVESEEGHGSTFLVTLPAAGAPLGRSR